MKKFDRKETTFLYKCRLCGEVINGATVYDVDVAFQVLVEATVNGRSSYSRLGKPLRMVSSHVCTDGSYGVTDLIGYRTDTKEVNVRPGVIGIEGCECLYCDGVIIASNWTDKNAFTAKCENGHELFFSVVKK